MAVTQATDGAPEVHTFEATSEADKQAEVNNLAVDEGPVLAVEPDVPVQALTIDDPVYSGPPGSQWGPQWWVSRVGFEAAWGAGFDQGSGVRVAVIDSGVQAAHEDLGFSESLPPGNVVAGADFVGSTPGDGRIDSGTHGTHVAGIVGAMDNQVGGVGGAPKVTIVPVRVLAGSIGTLSDVVEGIYWAADPDGGDADVINLSLGVDTCTPPPSLYSAVQYAVVDQHVTVVAAAGNCTTPDGCPSHKFYPAAFAELPELDGVIAVGATDQNNNRAWFSYVNPYVTIAAPGVAITSTLPAGNNSYGNKDGTSMASPMVAATAALVRARCPGYTPADVKYRLVHTAQDLGDSGTDTSFGAGLVRADFAVAAC